MKGLCPECAHILYGYPHREHACDAAGVFGACGWNQSRPRYIEKLLEERAR
jgi:hypothetical protein